MIVSRSKTAASQSDRCGCVFTWWRQRNDPTSQHSFSFYSNTNTPLANACIPTIIMVFFNPNVEKTIALLMSSTQYSNSKLRSKLLDMLQMGGSFEHAYSIWHGRSGQNSFFSSSRQPCPFIFPIRLQIYLISKQGELCMAVQITLSLGCCK